MRTVWKYDVPVDDKDHVHAMSSASKIIHVACQQPDVVSFWVDHAGYGIRERRFFVTGTGHNVPQDAVHVGTALAAGGRLVWHLWEQP